MDYSGFRRSELRGWSERASRYGDVTARATTQSVPALLSAVRIAPDMELLDLGCGPGYATGAANALGARAVGIDFSAEMVEVASRRFPDAAFAVGDAEAPDFPDARFDAVVGNMVLFHLTEPDAAMREARRVLRAGGRFAFSHWAGPSESDLYGTMMPILREHADASRIEPAPDAFALSDRTATIARMRAAGFADVEVRDVPNVLAAEGGSFFDIFMAFGVRVPLIVASQTEAVRARIRDRVDAAFERFRRGEGYRVAIPSLVYSGRHPG